MKRVTEPELMTDEEQARAYALADFEEPHEAFVSDFKRVFTSRDPGSYVLDLGCGPGDVSIRFARAFPECEVHGIDGSEAMLRFGVVLLDRAPGVRHRVRLICGMLPDAAPPRKSYDAVISNSLLHHLPEPRVLWQCVRRFAKSGAPVFVKDLMRPRSEREAREMTKQYVASEPEVLQQDFYNSLLASFEPDEIREQLAAAKLDFTVEQIGDRHVIAYGLAP
jgi:ubiquinone/menaquinone biosynthesis C-methylase UbiE